jgi:cytoskeletal protein CcmA (bactofilin family)
MMRKKGLWLGLLILMLLLPTAAVYADGPNIHLDGGQIFVEEDVSLKPGETVNGDLGIFDGDLTIPQSSSVNGDLFVINGDAMIAGQVNGSVAVVNGELTLTESSVVKGDTFVMSGDQQISGRVTGDLVSLFSELGLRQSAIVQGDVSILSGSMEREAGAQVLGDAVRDITLPELPFIRERLRVPSEAPRVTVPDVPPVPRLPREVGGWRFGSLVGRIASAGFLSLILIALGMLIVLIWPRPARKVSKCISAMPVQSFALGLLTFLIAAVLEALAMVLMILVILLAAALISTVILIPVGLLLVLLSVLLLLPVPLALVGGMVLGWVALAELLGRKLLHLLKSTSVRPLGATLLGLLITIPVAAVLWVAKPVCCAWPFVILLTSVGLGAVIHTRFGRQDCRQSPSPDAEELLPVEAMDDEAGLPDMPPDTTA